MQRSFLAAFFFVSVSHLHALANETTALLPPAATLTQPGALIIRSDFSKTETLPRKGASGWVGNFGTWTTREGILEGSEDKGGKHHASCVHFAEFSNALVTTEVRLGKAEEISFELREAGAPHPHIGRIFLTRDALWINSASGISKTKTTKLLQKLPVSLNPEAWQKVILEIYGGHVRARIGSYVMDADDSRFTAKKGSFALIVRGEGAQFKNLVLWHAEPKD